MATSRTSRSWKKYYKKTKTGKIRTSIKFKIQEIKNSKEGLSSLFLEKCLTRVKNFIGVFPQDFLLHSQIYPPACFVVNLDVSSQPGSHWLAVYLDDSSVEVFDSLGLDPKTWTRKPTILLNFIKSKLKNRKLRISRKLQTDSSNFCGVFSLFFLFLRPFLTFRQISNFFTSDLKLNEKLLYDFFQ